jgi:pilus assembly protein CpaC
MKKDVSMLASFKAIKAPGRRLAAALGALMLAAPLGAMAQTPAPFNSGGGEVVRVDLAGGGATQNLSLPRGQSAVIELPVDARDVLVSDPKVADVSLRSPRRIYIMGMASGSTDAVFFDQTGRRILRVNIRVDADISALQDTLARVVGPNVVKAEGAGDNLILTGVVANAPTATRPSASLSASSPSRRWCSTC